jgi:hypothetical protein
MKTMKLYQEYLEPLLSLGERPQVWKYTVLVNGKKHRCAHRCDVPAVYTGTMTYEADPVALFKADAWDDREREIFEAAHDAWKNDLFAQYSSLLSRAQFDRAYEILEDCTRGDERLTNDEIAEHFEELYGFLFC